MKNKAPEFRALFFLWVKLLKKAIYTDDFLAAESVLTFSSCVRTKPYFNFAVLFRIVPTLVLYNIF